MKTFNLIATFVCVFTSYRLGAEKSQFDIETPRFMCPKTSNSTFDKPDYVIISIKPEDKILNITWLIRWTPVASPTQRFTLLLWKKVRALEKKLNDLQSEDFTYKIKNDELLSGVNYTFNITATFDSKNRTSKYFSINYIEKQIKGESDIFNVKLRGARVAYVDIEVILEADVTSCWEIQDYYFIWTVSGIETNQTINVSNTTGCRLEIPPYTFKPGNYEIISKVVRDSNNKIIEKANISIEVLPRGLEIYLNVDKLIISKNNPFVLDSLVINHDYTEYSVQYNWQCFDEEKECIFFEGSGESAYNFSIGISSTGEYTVLLTVSVLDQSATASATIITINENVQIFEIQPTHRIINENSVKTLSVRAINMAPSCSLTWYFSTKDLNVEEPNNCTHGEAISKILALLSLENNILEELTDFENDTEMVEIEAKIMNKSGKARFVAKCDIKNESLCENNVAAYAEVYLKLNEGPKIYNVTINPKSETALETMFRISSRAVDSEGPLLYTFYSSVGTNYSLLLGSYSDHGVLETFLPYIDGDTQVWVTVCDVLGACSKSAPQTIKIKPNKRNKMNALINIIHSHIKRCEVMHVLHVAVAAVASYSNAGQSDLSIFTTPLLESLPGLSRCLSEHHYQEVLNQLADVGLDINF